MRHNSASCSRTLRHADFFWEDWGSNCQPSGWRTTTLPSQRLSPLYFMMKQTTATFQIYLMGISNNSIKDRFWVKYLLIQYLNTVAFFLPVDLPRMGSVVKIFIWMWFKGNNKCYYPYKKKDISRAQVLPNHSSFQTTLTLMCPALEADVLSAAALKGAETTAVS